MFCISLGKDSQANGIACVSIGDGVKTVGAFQVATNSTITIPEESTTTDIRNVINNLKELIVVYDALSKQGFAPKDFGFIATKAIEIAINDLVEKYKEKEKLEAEKEKTEKLETEKEKSEQEKPKKIKVRKVKKSTK